MAGVAEVKPGWYDNYQDFERIAKAHLVLEVEYNEAEGPIPSWNWQIAIIDGTLGRYSLIFQNNIFGYRQLQLEFINKKIHFRVATKTQAEPVIRVINDVSSGIWNIFRDKHPRSASSTPCPSPSPKSPSASPACELDCKTFFYQEEPEPAGKNGGKSDEICLIS
ncbi:MAG: hypothetical protein HZB76_00400 [Chlamydiae bacterium]|nr:hypothetical protein [Chlamydiota bacterium]